MSQITTHILDTTLGRPAAGVTVVLHDWAHDAGWREIARGFTDADGHLLDLLLPEERLAHGAYQLRFFTQQYFEQLHTTGFYPFVDVCFVITDESHYYVPLLLNPFGYSTYRGA